MDDKAIYEALVTLVREHIPGFEVAFKDESWSQRLLGKLMFFNKNYMTSFTTTLYPRVYLPSRKWLEESYGRTWKVLAHEFVHLWDRRRVGVGFNLAYLSPQIGAVLALLAVFAFLSKGFLLALLALLCLAPIPSYGRMYFELRGYTMSMAVNLWRYGSISEDTKAYIASHFLGGNYYWMWPFPKGVRGRIDQAAAKLAAGDTSALGPSPEVYGKVYQMLKNAGADLAS